MASSVFARGRRAAVLACALATGAMSAGVGGAAASEKTVAVVRVIDGDTFVVSGGERIRVRNFDTPELRRYDCLEEKQAAQAARRAARRLLSGRRVTLSIAGRDRYRRTVADVAVHQGPRAADFVALMTARGHGKRWRYGREPQPDWCPAG